MVLLILANLPSWKMRVFLAPVYDYSCFSEKRRKRTKNIFSTVSYTALAKTARETKKTKTIQKTHRRGCLILCYPKNVLLRITKTAAEGIFGADDENRTRIAGFEDRSTDHCATSAYSQASPLALIPIYHADAACLPGGSRRGDA